MFMGAQSWAPLLFIRFRVEFTQYGFFSHPSVSLSLRREEKDLPREQKRRRQVGAQPLERELCIDARCCGWSGVSPRFREPIAAA